jgi:cation:H+ antiporter
MLDLLFVAAGLVLLFAGGEALVRGAVSLARRLGVSPLVIGLTLVGFGTSAPELTTSLQAALNGLPGIAVGNVVGSNIANLLLILGISALVAPIAVDRAALRRDGSMLAATTLGVGALLVFDVMTWPVGLALVALLVAYIVFVYLAERRAAGDASAALHAHEAEAVALAGWELGILLALGGLVGVIGGAALLVEGAVAIASRAGVSDTLIGLTVVAVGTSLPELATSAIAARRGQGDVALGNLVGSNVFNLLGILGATAVVAPIPVPPEIAAFDVWVMGGVAALALLLAVTGQRVSRGEGALLLLVYCGYIAYLAVAQLGLA